MTKTIATLEFSRFTGVDAQAVVEAHHLGGETETTTPRKPALSTAA